MKKVAILQSNYIPWKGYFDIINSVDEFVLYDSMQYTRRDWRNRNKIKTPQGTQWLTIPIDSKGKFFQKINETVVAGTEWRSKHWKTIIQNYSKSPFFNMYKERFEALYLHNNELNLSELNFHFIREICSILEINTSFRWSREFTLTGNPTENLLTVCTECEATQYLSGPAAKEYIDLNLFNDAGITVQWMNYSKYPEYSQQFPPFEHSVSILDLLFNEGPQAKLFMKSFKE